MGTGAAEAGGHALRSTRNVTRGLRRETGDGSARLRGLRGLWGVRLPRGTARQRCHHVQAAPVGGLCLRPPAQELSTEEATRGRLGAGFLWGSPGAAPGPCRAGTETDWGGQRGGAGAGARCRPLLAESAGLGQARLPRCSRCPARGAWCPSHSWRAVRGTRPGALLTEPPSPGQAPVAAHGCGSGARHGDGSHGLCVLTCPCPCPCPLAVPSDLTPEECQELENIRRRKQELLADIQVRCSGLPCVLPHPRPSQARRPLAQARPCVPRLLPRSWARGRGRRRGCSAQDPQCPCWSRAGLGLCPRPLPCQPCSLRPVQAPLEFLGRKIGAAGSAGQGGPGHATSSCCREPVICHPDGTASAGPWEGTGAVWGHGGVPQGRGSPSHSSCSAEPRAVPSPAPFPAARGVDVSVARAGAVFWGRVLGPCFCPGRWLRGQCSSGTLVSHVCD